MTDTPAERGVESTWTRLRRRKVVQWGLVYVAAAWGFLQGLEYVSEAFQWPAQLRQIALLVLLIGLPIVLVLAWYHGDRGQQHITTPEFAILTLLLLLGGGAFWYYQRASEAGKDAAAPKANAVQSETSPGIKDARPSVAVLPFENRSDESKDAFFVDGIHDDILTQLSKISALRVISRTSVEQFRDTKLPMKAIAEHLGVAKILEGGVQRAGDRVRINVQLIDAATDGHLWAEQYDRELTAANIFAIQSEVASSIADALRATLTPSERTTVNAVPTQNLAAWEAYHLGRQALSRRTVEGLADAVGQFERAIQLDPAFALAYVALADTLTLQVDYGGTERDSATDRAGKLVTRALELQPGLTEAAVSAALIAWTRFDYVLAESEFKHAIELNPNSVEANHWYSGVLSDLGRRREAEIYARRAAQLDPRSGIVRVNLGSTLENLGRFDEAIAEYGRAIEIQPSNPNAYAFMGFIEAYVLGRVDRAVPWFQRAVELDPTSGFAPAWLTTMYLDLGDQAEAERWLAQAIRAEADQALPKLVSCKVALLAGRPALAVEHAKDALEMLPKSPDMLQVLRDNDLRKGKYAQARARYARPYPELLEAVPTVNSSNVAAAIDLTLVLKMSGDNAGATRLLALSEAAIQDMPRLGTNGFGIADVYIYALRGEKRKALLAWQTAVRAGWHGPWPFWRLARDHDENLSSIRNEPEFDAAFADIERDMVKQRAALAARPKDAPLDLAATGT